MARKLPTTSAETVVQMMAAATLPMPDVPKHIKLRKGDKPFWDDILRARAKTDWLPSDLVVVAQLARCQADIERETAELDGEGSVIENNRGTPIMNPRHSVLEQLARRELALMRTLRMGSAAGSPVTDAKRRTAAGQAQSVMESLRDEDLLAT